MQEVLARQLSGFVKTTYGVDVRPEFSRPDPQFGDVATNVAMKLTKQVGKNPREIAEALSEALRETKGVSEVAVAGPGFINIRFDDQALADAWSVTVPERYKNETVIVEYSDPNPFKVLHAGHLYTSVMGDAIANLVQASGGDVHRVNFGGDVGLHVGKTMWAILSHFDQYEHDENKALFGIKGMSNADINTKMKFLSTRYVQGSNAYEDDVKVKEQITAYNKRVYQLHSKNDHESDFAKIYWICRDWSYDYFNAFYTRIGSSFEKYYPESSVAERGLKEVKAQVGETFSKSDGAVVFTGEPFGLHTRVFINREGLPTYEAKDVGLIFTKYDDYAFDRSIVITANEQEQYMKVVLKAIEQFAPKLAQSTQHLTHGMVKLAGGVKMSSRKGNFLRAVDVLQAADDANTALNGQTNEVVSLGAVKYAFLRQGMGGDIVYDPDESVSLQGNSGPYLQYAHARACSILAKAGEPSSVIEANFQADERALALKLSEYPEVLHVAVSSLKPHHICTYLYELAQVFNRFYEKNRVIGDEREAMRLALVGRYQQTLQHGLGLLGITAPEKL